MLERFGPRPRLAFGRVSDRLLMLLFVAQRLVQPVEAFRADRHRRWPGDQLRILGLFFEHLRPQPGNRLLGGLSLLLGQ
jgi:hypothetical protein